MDWPSLTSSFMGALGGGFAGGLAVILCSMYREWRNKPRLDIEFYQLSGEEKYIHERDIAKLPQGGEYKIRELSLIVKNTGKVHAENCIAKLSVFKVRKSGIRPEPLQIILGWRRNYWLKKWDRMGDPITIAKNDEEELHFLGVYYFVTPDGKEIKFGKEVRDCPKNIFGKVPELGDIKFGLATPFIAHYNFQPNTKYILKVTVFPANSDPVSKTFELHWNGEIGVEDLKSSIEYSTISF